MNKNTIKHDRVTINSPLSATDTIRPYDLNIMMIFFQRNMCLIVENTKHMEVARCQPLPSIEVFTCWPTSEMICYCLHPMRGKYVNKWGEKHELASTPIRLIHSCTDDSHNLLLCHICLSVKKRTAWTAVWHISVKKTRLFYKERVKYAWEVYTQSQSCVSNGGLCASSIPVRHADLFLL